MATTAADVLIERLQDWGVEVVFGLPGDGINGIMEALRTCRDRIRHEAAAAFMACGYAKFTGRLGVCLATSGPGGHSPAGRRYAVRNSRLLGRAPAVWRRGSPARPPGGIPGKGPAIGLARIVAGWEAEARRLRSRRTPPDADV